MYELDSKYKTVELLRVNELKCFLCVSSPHLAHNVHSFLRHFIVSMNLIYHGFKCVVLYISTHVDAIHFT